MSRHLPPLPYQTRADLFLHLAALEKAGLPTDKAFAIVETTREAQPRLHTMRRLLARRVGLAAAGLNSGLFTAIEARLVGAAADAGSPMLTYQRLQQRYTARAAQLARIKSRAILPLVTLLLALLVQPLPRLFTGAISPGAYALQAFGPLLAILLAGACVLQLQAAFLSGAALPGRSWIERTLPQLPTFGPMHLRAATRDFIENLAMLLQAGLPMFEAVSAAQASVNNRHLRQRFAGVLPVLKQGGTLAQALARLDLPDGDQLAGFAMTGESSGALPEMLMRHAGDQSASLYQFQDQLSQWLPRLLYAAVAAWMVAQILGAPAAVPPHL